MKAFYATAYGGLDRMRFGDLPDPAAGPTEVVVQVRAASVNPVDWKIRNGEMRVITGHRFPRVLGVDFAGAVASTGRSVRAFTPGERVYGTASTFRGRDGGHAERVAVPATSLRRIPEPISFEQAAALPVAGVTAVNGLARCGPLADEQVLVNGATGGVGHFALQIAKARGARVTAVCSARNFELARKLGANDVLDRATEDFTRSHRRWDVVFDAWGGLGFARAAEALGPRGVYATTLPLPRVFLEYAWQRLRRSRRRLVLATGRQRQEAYADLEKLVVAGAVKPYIETVVPLERAREAFEISEQGRARGKVIIRVG